MRSRLGETYIVLTKDGGYDGKAKPDVFGDAIDLVMEELFVPGTTVDALTSPTIRRYVADKACLEVIPVAINYHLERTGRSDTIGQPGRGNAILSSEARQHYDRVSGLGELAKQLRAALVEREGTFLRLAGALSPSVLPSVAAGPNYGPAISTTPEDILTDDPSIIGPPGGRTPVPVIPGPWWW
jgi:hypothetical protein